MTSSQHASNVGRGIELLHDPRRNKSTAFTEAEREGLGLTGLLPSGAEDEEAQVRRPGAVRRGVQFPPVRLGDRTFITGQANNLYIFPAIGLAIYATQATRVPDELFITAATGVADQVTQAELDSGLLYPPQTSILQTEVTTAIRVCEVIFDRGLASVQQRPGDIRAFVEAQPYTPEYPDVGSRH